MVRRRVMCDRPIVADIYGLKGKLMKWNYETYEQKVKRLKRWRKHFAFMPVSYQGVTYWLQYVERRARFVLRFSDFVDYEYRGIK